MRKKRVIQNPGSQSKQAIFDPKIQGKLLGAADPETERPAIWLMMRAGMHPQNIVKLKSSNLVHDFQGWWLQYERVKNERMRRELLPNDIGEMLSAWLRGRGRPGTRQAYWVIARRVGLRIGLEGISPMTLRHTACITFLRELKGHPERLWLVAGRMGCHPETVRQNYLDLAQWEKMR